MESPIQEDPYLSLGVSQGATAAEIKSAYRKAALRSHPDKVTDETLKKQKADEFHRVQQAYEILNDEEKRSRYDARIRLAELKAEMMRREGATRGPASPYERRPPPSAFPGYGGGSFEVRVPKYASDDLTPEPRSASRKHSDAGAYVRRTSAPTSKGEEKKRSEKEDKARSERRRARDADIRDSRDRKYHSSSETVNDRSHFEEERRKRDDVVKSREDAMRRAADDRRMHDAMVAAEMRRAEEARKAKPTFTTPDYSNDYSKKFDEARRYMESADYSSTRPRPVRTSSKDYYGEGEVRRSRTRPTESRRRSPEVVDPPSLNKSATTGHTHVLRDMVNEGSRMPERSYSNNVGADLHDRIAAPTLGRHATMPNVHSRESRKDTKGSKLRPEVKIPADSGYSSPGTPTPEQAAPSTPKVSTYRYTPNPTAAAATAADAEFTSSPDTYTAPYATLETRAPKAEKDRSERRRGREGSADLPRPPMGPTRSYSKDEVPRRPSYTTRDSDRERDRDRSDRDRDRAERRRDRERDSDRRTREKEKELYYGEVPSDYTKKNGIRSKAFNPEDVNMAKPYSRDDIRVRSDASYMRSGRDRGYDERERDYPRPSMSRSNTINVW